MGDQVEYLTYFGGFLEFQKSLNSIEVAAHKKIIFVNIYQLSEDSDYGRPPLIQVDGFCTTFIHDSGRTITLLAAINFFEAGTHYSLLLPHKTIDGWYFTSIDDLEGEQVLFASEICTPTALLYCLEGNEEGEGMNNGGNNGANNGEGDEEGSTSK